MVGLGFIALRWNRRFKEGHVDGSSITQLFFQRRTGISLENNDNGESILGITGNRNWRRVYLWYWENYIPYNQKKN
jgi:hypothetical protein